MKRFDNGEQLPENYFNGGDDDDRGQEPDHDYSPDQDMVDLSFMSMKKELYFETVQFLKENAPNWDKKSLAAKKKLIDKTYSDFIKSIF